MEPQKARAKMGAPKEVLKAVLKAKGRMEVQPRLPHQQVGEQKGLEPSQKVLASSGWRQGAATKVANAPMFHDLKLMTSDWCRNCGGTGHWGNERERPKPNPAAAEAAPDPDGGKGGKAKGKGKGKDGGKDGAAKGKGKGGRRTCPGTYQKRTSLPPERHQDR
jgi:hypothetical protein